MRGQLSADAVHETRVHAVRVRDGAAGSFFTADLADRFRHEEHAAHPGMHGGEAAAVGVDRQRPADAQMRPREIPTSPGSQNPRSASNSATVIVKESYSSAHSMSLGVKPDIS